MIADTIPNMFHILKSRYVEQYGETKGCIRDKYSMFERYVCVSGMSKFSKLCIAILLDITTKVSYYGQSSDSYTITANMVIPIQTL